MSFPKLPQLPQLPQGPLARALSGNGGVSAPSASSNGGDAAPSAPAPTPKFGLPGFQIPVVNPLSGAIDLVQGTVENGVKSLHEGAEAVLGSAPQIPVVLPGGGISIIKGGVEGLKDLKENAQSVLENAPKLPGLATLPGLPSLPGVPGASGFPALPDPLGLGKIGEGLVGGALGGAQAAGGLLGGGLINNVFTTQNLIQQLIEAPQKIITFLAGFTKQIIALWSKFMDPKFGLKEFQDFLTDNLASVIKLTFLAVLAASVLVWSSFVLALIAGAICLGFVPLLWGAIVVLGGEILAIKYIRQQKPVSQ